MHMVLMVLLGSVYFAPAASIDPSAIQGFKVCEEGLICKEVSEDHKRRCEVHGDKESIVGNEIANSLWLHMQEEYRTYSFNHWKCPCGRTYNK